MTTSTTATVKELHTSIEDAASIQRENGDCAEFTVQHYGDVLQLSVSIIDAETEEPGGPMEFSVTEARALRTLLNNPSVVALLDVTE